ncbi:hypothetical protein ANCDUO_09259 [Ancylostoma duodenale]|uniref:SXP/RAL-2 family protein Ani s 5-like cation-binding domain-containing protein n=1 Tax=Ancylostoma duodenale TaxID=51022 RepID=A0A0C2GTK5_9BILA|nr:hypothetical protein ANCDUO_09259 [Ancylostoma duodenale]
MEFRKIGEKQYKEYADAGEKGVTKFFESTRKLISKLDHFFTKSKNIGEDKRQSYDSMKKAVRNVFSGLTEDQKMIASFIIYTYGVNFFPFLTDIWCMECIDSGDYLNGNGGYPGNNGGYPGNNGGYSGNNGGYPGSNGVYPGGNGGPYPGGPYPGNGGGYPGWPNNNAGPYPGNNNNNGVYPGGNGGFLGGNGNYPGANGGFPGHNGGYPGNNGGYPGGNGWFPGSGGYPGNGDRLPNTNGNRGPNFGNGHYGQK